jgi:hypothetical protein
MKAGRRLGALLAWPLAALAPPPAAGEGAIAVYTGPFTINHYDAFFLRPWEIRSDNAWLFTVAPSWKVAQPSPALSLEVEGQVGRYVGDQTNWEVNGLVAARYRLSTQRAPVRASVAAGLGLSRASRRPALEKTLNQKGETYRWMAYWYVEMAGGHRSWGPWTALVRLHHRSGAYGVIAPRGGVNVPSLGLRRRF